MSVSDSNSDSDAWLSPPTATFALKAMHPGISPPPTTAGAHSVRSGHSASRGSSRSSTPGGLRSSRSAASNSQAQPNPRHSDSSARAHTPRSSAPIKTTGSDRSAIPSRSGSLSSTSSYSRSAILDNPGKLTSPRDSTRHKSEKDATEKQTAADKNRKYLKKLRSELNSHQFPKECHDYIIKLATKAGLKQGYKLMKELPKKTTSAEETIELWEKPLFDPNTPQYLDTSPDSSPNK